MRHTIITAIAVVAGIAVFSGVSSFGTTSAASAPVTKSAPVAPKARDGGVARPGQWTFEGKSDLRDSGALELKVRSTAGVPRAYDLAARLLVGREVLLVNNGAPIVDVTGRKVAVRFLEDAILRVKGTLLPTGQWRYDLDGEATPVVRVSRITVLGLDLD